MGAGRKWPKTWMATGLSQEFSLFLSLPLFLVWMPRGRPLVPVEKNQRLTSDRHSLHCNLTKINFNLEQKTPGPNHFHSTQSFAQSCIHGSKFISFHTSEQSKYRYWGLFVKFKRTACFREVSYFNMSKQGWIVGKRAVHRRKRDHSQQGQSIEFPPIKQYGAAPISINDPVTAKRIQQQTIEIDMIFSAAKSRQSWKSEVRMCKFSWKQKLRFLLVVV